MKFLKLLSINILLGLVFIKTGYSQTREEIRAEYRKERRAMMREMMKMLKQDQNEILKEFDQQMDPFDNIARLRKGSRSRIRVTQSRELDGSIAVIVHLNKKDANIDISTKDNVITIKSINKNSNSTSRKTSHFSQRISIPSGYIAKDPVQVNEGIKISLVRKK